MQLRTPEMMLTAFSLAMGMVVVGGACNSSGGETGCSADEDCPSGRVCVDGVCLNEDRQDVASDARNEGEEPDGATDPAAPSDGGTPRRDGSRPGADGGGITPDGSFDIGDPEEDTRTPGEGRALSCHEFATCQFIVCDQFDYSCKEEYSSRTSEQQISQLDERQTCLRENCSGLQGVERAECRAENCASEYEACGNRPGNGEDLDCGEFHACIDLCNGKASRQTCRANCRERATTSAQRSLQNYNECFTKSCQGTEGRETLRCARRNCFDELSECWGC